MKKSYYVYYIIVDDVVRYVGKGIGQRVNIHLKKAQSLIRRRASGEVVQSSHFYNKLAKAYHSGAKVKDLIVVDGLLNDESFAIEVVEIASFPTGQLWNTLEGGNGFSSEDIRKIWASLTPEEREYWGRGRLAYTRSETQKQRLRALNEIINHDPVVLAKRSATMKRLGIRPSFEATSKGGKLQLGRKHSPETCQKQSIGVKEHWADPVQAEAHAKALRGVKRSDEARTNISIAQKKRAPTLTRDNNGRFC